MYFRNAILIGDIRQEYKKIPKGKVNVIGTSPPYFNKRIYAKKVLEADGLYHAYPDPLIWGGQENCQHEWENKTKKVHNGRGDAQKSKKFSQQAPVADIIYHYAICKKCNAYMGELGHEKNHLDFIEHLASIFDLLYDVVADDGACWINLGDSMKNGEQLNIPILFAERMKKRGWILKRARPWVKNNPLPSSDPNNFGMDYEFFLFFTKKRSKYFHNPQYVPYAESTLKELNDAVEKWQSKYDEGGSEQGGVGLKGRVIESIKTRIAFGGTRAGEYGNPLYSGNEWEANPLGALERATIKLNTKGTKLKHYAAFPPDFAAIPIKASCPTHICAKCGTPRRIAYKERKIPTRPGKNVHTTDKSATIDDPNMDFHKSEWSTKRLKVVRTEDGFIQCDCPEPKQWERGVVLDPFAGTGMTGVVARELGRDYILCELNQEYAEMATNFLKDYETKTVFKKKKAGKKNAGNKESNKSV